MNPVFIIDPRSIYGFKISSSQYSVSRDKSRSRELGNDRRPKETTSSSKMKDKSKKDRGRRS